MLPREGFTKGRTKDEQRKNRDKPLLVFRMHGQKRSRATDLKDPRPTSVIRILRLSKIIKRPEMGAFL